MMQISEAIELGQGQNYEIGNGWYDQAPKKLRKK
jgi:hypothetical protein